MLYEVMNVSISEKTHKVISQISETEGLALSEVLEEAVESYRRQKFLAETNQAFQKLREDRNVWRDEIAEREIWEQTLVDGIEKDD